MDVVDVLEVNGHSHILEPIINARDCELAGFDLALVFEAAKAEAR